MLNYKSKPKEDDEFMNKWQKKAEYWFIKKISKKHSEITASGIYINYTHKNRR